MLVRIWSYKHDSWWRHKGMGYSRDPDDAGAWPSIAAALAGCSFLEDALYKGISAAVIWGDENQTEPYILAARHVRTEKQDVLAAFLQESGPEFNRRPESTP